MSGIDEQGPPQCVECIKHERKVDYWVFDKVDEVGDWKNVVFFDVKPSGRVRCNITQEYITSHVVFKYDGGKSSIEDYTLNDIQRVSCNHAHVNNVKLPRFLQLLEDYMAQEGMRVE